MAHSAYDCCMICDSKMGYNEGDAQTKATACAPCAVALARHGVFAEDDEQLLAWMQTETPERVLAVLQGVGFSTCIFQNPVDDRYTEIGGGPAPAWWRQLGAALQREEGKG